MKSFWYALLTIILFSSCNSGIKRINPEDYISNEATIVLSINDIENFKSNSKNNHLIKELSATEAYTNTTKTLDYLNNLSTTNPIYVCLIKNENDSLQFSFSTKYQDSIFKIDSLKTIQKEVVNLKGVSAEKIEYNNQTIYLSIKDSVLVGANTAKQLETLFSKDYDNSSTKKLLSTQNKDALFSIILNTENLNTSLFNNTNLTHGKLTNHLVFDAVLSQDEVILSGITKANDSSKSAINAFKNTIPQENELAKIAPSNSNGFLSLTFNDYAVFKENLDREKTKDSLDTKTALFDNIIETGVIYDGENKAVALNSIDVIATEDALLSEKTTDTEYRGVTIYNFSKPEIFKEYFSPFITFTSAKKYCIIDQFFVFSNSTEVLENIIANYQNQTTFSAKAYYKDISKQLSSNASILQVVTPKNLKEIVSTNLNTVAPLDLKGYKASAVQFIYDSNFAHFNAVIGKSKSKATENSITEILNIKLDNDILNTPQFVKNHRTRQKDIVVQDIKNKLYLISNTGRIRWKKQLNGPILGRIEQIDMYKNGRLQLAFATPKRVYVLDRNGKDVKPFPLKFNDEITQPLSVFDYDKRRNYRLFVTQGKELLLYDGKGKSVKGFKFSSAKAQINNQPQHIRIGSKDYIIVKTEDKLHIINRRGANRVVPKTKTKYSNQPVYSYKSNFITTTKNGDLISIDRKGNTNITNKKFDETHHIVSTTKTLVTLNNNTLTIKDKTVELDFANYSKPQLFYLNDKIYVSITNLQSQKVLLFDSQAKPIDNFPVYGNSTIDLDNIDSHKNLEFVTKGESNTILVYKIN